MYLAFEMFQEKDLRKCWKFPYLVLQGCILFLRRFRQEWRTSVFALFAKNAVAHMMGSFDALRLGRKDEALAVGD